MKLSITIVVGAVLIGIASSFSAEEIRDCEVCPALVVVPAGEFVMGTETKESTHPDEKPLHPVKIAKPFAAGKFEVTFDQWDACVAQGECQPIGEADFGRGDQPVINVDWTGAKGYVAWLSKMTGKTYRLLSEAEWEYAARAGTTTAWFWGTIDDGIGVSEACQFSNTHDMTSKKVNTGYNWLAHPCDDGFAHTAPVGTFKPNAFGLYDMLGNVREWVEDCYGMYVDAPADGSPATSSDCERRIARGGGWLDGPTWVRSGYRDPHPANFANYAVGFRVARDVQ